MVIEIISRDYNSWVANMNNMKGGDAGKNKFEIKWQILKQKIKVLRSDRLFNVCCIVIYLEVETIVFLLMQSSQRNQSEAIEAIISQSMSLPPPP